MSTLNITKRVPKAVTGLTVQLTTGGAVLTWNGAQDATDVYQVYTNTTNSLATATLLADNITATTYTAALQTGATSIISGGGPFYWVRAKNTYGVTGPWDTSLQTTYGATFNTKFLYVFADANASFTLSADIIKAKVYYTPLGGAPTNTGFVSFTTAITQTSTPDVNWTNPGNANVDDGSNATVALTSGQASESLVCALSDLGVPATATVTGIQVTFKGQVSANRANCFISCDIDGSSESFPTFSTNATVATLTAGTSTSLMGLNDGGQYVFSEASPIGVVPALSMGNNTANMVLNAYSFGQATRTASGFFTNSLGTVTSVGTTFSGGISVSSPAVSLAAHEPGTGWSTWYDVYSGNAIDASPAPTKVFTNIFFDIDWTGLSITTGTASYELQVSLYNVTDSTDISTENFTLMAWSGSSAAVVRSNPIFNMSWLFQNGINSVSIPSGKTLDVRLRVRKVRSDSATTLTMYINRVMIETSFE